MAWAEGPCSSPVPGMTVMVFRARSTRKVLRAEMLPKSTNSVRYLGGEVGARAVSEPGVGGRAEVTGSPGPEGGFPRNPRSWGYRGVAGGQVRHSKFPVGAREVGKTVQQLC